MRATPIAHYRGATSPVEIAQPTTPVTTSRPLMQTAPAGAYKATDVLARTISRWNDTMHEDGIAHPRRVTPWVDFGGFGRVCSTLIPEDRDQRPVQATSDVNIAPSGMLLFRTRNTLTYYGLVSARIDSAGVLTQIAVTKCEADGDYAPLVTEKGFVLCAGDSEASGSKISSHGSLSPTHGFAGRGPAIRLEGEHFVMHRNGMLRIFYAKPDGQLSESGNISGATSTPSGGGITVHNGKLIAALSTHLASYELNGTTLKRVGALVVGNPKAVLECTPTAFIGSGIGVTAERNSGTLHSFAMLPTGELVSKQTCQIAAHAGEGIAIIGNYAVFGSGKDVRTVRVGANGELTPVGLFPTNGKVTARPTITRDGVILIGSADGNVYALSLGADGHLNKLTSRDLGGPVTTAVTVTSDGYALAASSAGLFALKD